MRRPLGGRVRVIVGVIVAIAVLAGCVAPRENCVSWPSRGGISFWWEGDESALMEALRAEGWNVTKRPHALGWTMAKEEWTGGGVLVPIAGPGNASLGVEGYHGPSTEDEARADLEPALAPLAARFRAGKPVYEAGYRRCW